MSELNQTPTPEADDRVENGQKIRRLRLWPAFLIVAIQLLMMFGPGLLSDVGSVAAGGQNVQVESSFVDNPQLILNRKLLGPLVGTLLLLIWCVSPAAANSTMSPTFI